MRWNREAEVEKILIAGRIPRVHAVQPGNGVRRIVLHDHFSAKREWVARRPPVAHLLHDHRLSRAAMGLSKEPKALWLRPPATSKLQGQSMCRDGHPAAERLIADARPIAWALRNTKRLAHPANRSFFGQYGCKMSFAPGAKPEIAHAADKNHRCPALRRDTVQLSEPAEVGEVRHWIRKRSVDFV